MMWGAIKEAAIKHIAATVVASAAAAVGFVAIATWGMFSSWWHQTNFEIQAGEHLPPIELSSGTTPISRGSSIGLRASEGNCSLSMVSGRFDNTTERVGVYISNGEWVYDFNHGAAKIAARIDCFRIPKLIPTSG